MLTDYCKNPTKYRSEMPIEIQKLYDKQCQTHVNGATKILPTQGFFLPGNSQKTSKASAKTIAFTKAAEGLGGDQNIPKDFGETLLNLIQMLMSPEGLAMIAAMMGGKVAAQAIYAACVNFLKSGFREGIADAMEEMYEKGVSAAVINASALLDGMLSEGFAKWGVVSAGRYALAGMTKLLAQTFEIVEGLSSILFLPMLGFQLMGMMFDAWDPCGMNNYLDGSVMEKITDAYNKNFQQAILESEMNDKQSATTWPVVIPFNMYFANYISNDQQAAYNKISLTHSIKYLSTIKTDSYGNLVQWPTGGRLATNDVLNSISSRLSSRFSSLANDNSVVASWLDLHFYWVFLIIFLLLILFVRYVFL